MPVFLVVVAPPGEGRLGVRFDQSRVTLGREEDMALSLPEPSVAAHHATLKKRGPHLLLSDEGSSSGTGVQVRADSEIVWLGAGAPRILQGGEILTLGQVKVQVTLEEPEDGVTWVAAGDLPRELVRTALLGLSLPAGPKDVKRALEELRREDESPPEEESTPERPRQNPTVLEPTRGWDLTIALAALLIVLGAAYGLFWLLG